MMPFPLVVPLAMAAASTATSTSTIALGGAVAGGASIGGLWWWQWRFSAIKPSPEHMTALEQQNQLTQARIKAARQVVNELCEKTTALTGQIINATSNVSETTEHIQVLREELVSMREMLANAMTLANESCESLSVSEPFLKELTDKVVQMGHVFLNGMTQLKELLDAKTIELREASISIGSLSSTVERQAANLAQLTTAFQAVSLENASRKDLIARQSQMQQRFFTAIKTDELFDASLGSVDNLLT